MNKDLHEKIAKSLTNGFAGLVIGALIGFLYQLAFVQVCIQH